MDKIKLIKREYLGKGIFCEFLNKENNDSYLQEIDQKLYDLICGVDGYKHNPMSKDGYTLMTIFSDAIKVDNNSGILDLNEFTINDKQEYIVNFSEENVQKQRAYSEEEFNNKFIWQ